jgi:YVTN family beta-propeller protein
VTDTIDVGDQPFSVAFSPNGKKAYVANYLGSTVSVITVKTGEETDTIDVGDIPYSVAFSPNGKKAYVANYLDDTVSVIKTR